MDDVPKSSIETWDFAAMFDDRNMISLIQPSGDPFHHLITRTETHRWWWMGCELSPFMAATFTLTFRLVNYCNLPWSRWLELFQNTLGIDQKTVLFALGQHRLFLLRQWLCQPPLGADDRMDEAEYLYPLVIQHSKLENHHAGNRKTPYFDWAMFHSYGRLPESR